MSVIYEPRGRAAEYSLLACNLFSGCLHRCSYCYAPQTLHVTSEQFHTRVKPRPGILTKLRREAVKLQDTDRRVLLCFTCDPYPPEDIEQGTTRQAIKILRQSNITFQILTKAGMRAGRDFDLYDTFDAFASTLTFIDEKQSIEYEPKAALPAERIEALKLAHEAGITTWASLEPVLDVRQSLELIRQTYKFVDLFKIGKLNYRASSIDWRQFGIKTLELCREYGKAYYIKNDLAKYLHGIEIDNTDTRTIPKKSSRKAEILFTNI
jgi:DNA repair photolyase